ncbi:hypothetical protein D3C85_1677340 [compost metagenome]
MLGQYRQGIADQRLSIQAIEGVPEVIVDLLQTRRLEAQVQFGLLFIVQGLEAQTLDGGNTGDGHANRRQRNRLTAD